MRKLIGAMNMTLDGVCDHRVMMADEQVHQHYSDLLDSATTCIYGRITYQLMEAYWPQVLKSPVDNQATNDFARAIDKIQKLLFSKSLKPADIVWNNTILAQNGLSEQLQALREQPGGDILIGSPGMIDQYSRLNLINEYQIALHPLIAGSGMKLFHNINTRIRLKWEKTRKFDSGVQILYFSSPGE